MACASAKGVNAARVVATWHRGWDLFLGSMEKVSRVSLPGVGPSLSSCGEDEPTELAFLHVTFFVLGAHRWVVLCIRLAER